MNGNVYDSSAGSVVSDTMHACESFLESYRQGDIDVGGLVPPEGATLDVPLEILLSGNFPPPVPPNEAQRVREL